eukprot:gnl/MRDRNA2_/MRDRNA2_86383_c0_seq1.p1 gnl/MRDRNA2_/MRDRNA2_86383_c0~~gnl/MRDRNA2_/MRDRNA2_86383_c0_seq1.p1  ORF type:complete len:471 (-),score=31.57 gnl/MRDRNA2_/MRDRNA2_86383_c0_seq1:77-1489(-)
MAVNSTIFRNDTDSLHTSKKHQEPRGMSPGRETGNLFKQENIFKIREEKAHIEKNREMKELERATRTVFINNLNIKVTEKDLFILFTQKAGKVLDIYIICDKHTNKSKGLAYVELETIESMARALDMSGTELYRQPIQVRPSEMEKNVQWTIQKQAQQGIMNTHLAATPMLTNPLPGVDVVAAATAAAALLTRPQRSLVEHANRNQDAQQYRKVYIGNLPREINELVLRNMFEPFGPVESSNVIKDPSGKSQGYGFILFQDRKVVDKAIQAMNGMLIGSNIIKVNYVTSSVTQLTQNDVSSSLTSANFMKKSYDAISCGADLDRACEDDKLKINPQDRVKLIQKLAASANIALSPAVAEPSKSQERCQDYERRNSQSHMPHVPSTRFRLENMFDLNETGQEDGWECDLAEDVSSELSKIGRVKSVKVNKSSPGFVEVEMLTIEDAFRTRNSLDGRTYGGRQIKVSVSNCT